MHIRDSRSLTALPGSRCRRTSCSYSCITGTACSLLCNKYQAAQLQTFSLVQLYVFIVRCTQKSEAATIPLSCDLPPSSGFVGGCVSWEKLVTPAIHKVLSMKIGPEPQYHELFAWKSIFKHFTKVFFLNMNNFDTIAAMNVKLTMIILRSFCYTC